MLKYILALSLTLSFVACSSKNKKEDTALKSEKIDTQLSNTSMLNSNTEVGTNADKNVVTREKTQVIDYLNQLETEVFQEYDALFGTREYGSRGLAGKVDDCRTKLNSKKYGGEGGVKPPVTKGTDFAQEIEIENKDFKTQKIGYDEQGHLVGIKEENIKDRVSKFQAYRTELSNRRLELEEDLRICQAKIDSANQQ